MRDKYQKIQSGKQTELTKKFNKMKANTVISWQQATQISQDEKQEKERILQEVKDSDFSILDARDVQYYADILEITPNEVRRINMKTQNVNSYYMINTFIDDCTNDVFDFY